MKEIIVSYEPLVFQGEASKENRITKEQLIAKMLGNGTASFLNSRVVCPFEKALKDSKLEKLACGDFTISLKKKDSTSTTSWKGVYEKLATFLEIRADDGRAAKLPTLKFFEGIGYCIESEELRMQVDGFIKEEAVQKEGGVQLVWPKRKKNEVLPTRISLPNRDYDSLSQENGILVFQTKRFCTGIEEAVSEPFKAELCRWFEANTGYHRPDNVPNKKTGFVERTLEITPGTYIEVQLVPTETPEYRDVIGMAHMAIQELKDGEPTNLFKHTSEKNKRYVSIKSLQNYLSMENLEKMNLVTKSSRYDISP